MMNYLTGEISKQQSLQTVAWVLLAASVSFVKKFCSKREQSRKIWKMHSVDGEGVNKKACLGWESVAEKPFLLDRIAQVRGNHVLVGKPTGDKLQTVQRSLGLSFPSEVQRPGSAKLCL